ncbi:hypothetical protein CSHISOI_04651 [Colletotrichum shisoi]|uniref:Uncharacterized protein n=1 Tax=Colletotrichum shisoi TaxID=2078593 RepID=A0A5Q4BW04_9PEZI|nr:hypothetical protein CSHISOI_04651 [Colletotrichum shisoi]
MRFSAVAKPELDHTSSHQEGGPTPFTSASAANWQMRPASPAAPVKPQTASPSNVYVAR